ncbi:MAG: phosphotransferase [Gemmatimonas sp.]|nr:phosphotransferase [Gemmatimonas sp.]
MTAEEIQERSAQAVKAATDAGRNLGLEVRDPVVLHDVFSVVVHLAPVPVVARVPLVMPPDLRGARLQVRQQRELDVVAWLAARNVAIVAPSPLMPLVPVERDGFSMTFWELADVAEDHVPYGSVDSSLVVELHAALREYPAGELPFLSPVNHTVPTLLGSLAGTPDLIAAADLDRARREWEILEPVLASRVAFEERFPDASIQAVHGDAPSYNVILTRSGPRFADFEDVNLAPIEWDLAMGTPEDIESYTREASRRGYRGIDADVLRVMSAARMLQMVASLALVPQLPLLAEGLQPSIEAWRGMPFAGGLG